ncbi:unnamed protein product, partial [Timema podura]|nr:unnamed protein product [Timema podura]
STYFYFSCYSGLRVAHSAYGIVTSLSGEPEENIVVEAVGLDTCAHFQEESTTDEKGYFRIRGLQPQCEYLIGMKKGQEINRVYSVSQSSIKIKAEKDDVRGLRLIAFHPINQMDISAYIQASSQEHLKTLCVKLFLENAPEYPLHTIKMDLITGKSLTNTNNAGLILFPSIPVDGRGYFLLLDSSLPYSTHIYTTQTVHFKATSPFKHFKLFFASQSKHIEQDIGHSSYLAVPLIIILGLVYLHQQKIFPLLNKFAQTLNNVVASGPISGRPGNNESDHGNTDVVLVEPILNIKRKLKPRKTQFS